VEVEVLVDVDLILVLQVVLVVQAVVDHQVHIVDLVDRWYSTQSTRSSGGYGFGNNGGVRKSKIPTYGGGGGGAGGSGGSAEPSPVGKCRWWYR
jgi:uncharacterized membrane protein YgcG